MPKSKSSCSCGGAVANGRRAHSLLVKHGVKQETLSPPLRLAVTSRTPHAKENAGYPVPSRGQAGVQPSGAKERVRKYTSAPVGAGYFTRSRLNSERTIAELKARIQDLERSEKRLKDRLGEKGEELKDHKEEAKGRLLLLVEAESKLEEMEHSLRNAQVEGNRYRNWWLSDYHSLKAVIQLIPRRHDVEAIASSSLARYKTYRGDL
ncbi:hypothetical protein NMY22_g18225 [Coprinellus aureogranulatus]|nr:hypothetical protein NMY22_g18225 [Coprinellus aureogranulatus]